MSRASRAASTRGRMKLTTVCPSISARLSVPRQHFQAQGVFGVARGLVERDGRGIGAQHFDGEPLVARPDFRAEQLHRLAAQTGAATVPRDEKMAQMNGVFVLAVQGIRRNPAVVLKNNA